MTIAISKKSSSQIVNRTKLTIQYNCLKRSTRSRTSSTAETTKASRLASPNNIREHNGLRLRGFTVTVAATIYEIAILR